MTRRTWSRTRLKYAVECNREALKEDTPDDFEFTYIDIGSVSQGSISIPDSMTTFAEAPSRARRIADAGDCVISTVRTYLRAIALVPENDDLLVFSTGFAVLHPLANVDSTFLSWYLQGHDFVDRVEANSTGVSYPAISAAKIMSFDLDLPSLDEQQAIANFLDRETAQMDRLVQAQRQFIELLKERRASLIDKLVWSGFGDFQHAVLESDFAFPRVPSHWRKMRNKDLLSESQDLSEDGQEDLLTVSHLTGITLRSDKVVNMFEAETLEGYRIVRSGDLVINTMWAWMGALGISRLNGLVSPAYGVYRFHDSAEVDSRYFDYLYCSRPYVAEMTRHSRGIWESRLRLYPELFLRLAVAVPPMDEQREIANALDQQTAKIDELISEAERLVDLVLERRSALISGAVNGEVEIELSIA